MMLTFVCDPPSIAFTIPWIEYPIAWYGIFFALGFWLSLKLFEYLCDRFPFSSLTGAQIGGGIVNYMIVGIVFGARFFHLLFYEPIEWIYKDPWIFFRIREGGLASHGGMLCVWIMGYIYAKRAKLSLIHLSDRVIPAGMILAFWIRLGNFMNQEILGLPTSLPWGIAFQHPSTLFSYGLIPRHPVQLYEAFYYLFLGAVGVYMLARQKWAGFTTVLLCFALAFGRFALEFFKEEQSLYTIGYPLTMGQLLCLPMVLVGIYAYMICRPRQA